MNNLKHCSKYLDDPDMYLESISKIELREKRNRMSSKRSSNFEDYEKRSPKYKVVNNR